MECLGRNYLTDDEFKELLPKESLRNLLKYSTTWKKVDKKIVTWQFEHNNFQEYLAAKKLSSQTIETVKHLVSIDSHYNKIIPSWANTLSFLISLSENQNILNWVLEIDSKLCLKFEPDKIEESIRIRIFKEVFNEYKLKKIWIGDSIFSSYELTKFGQSDEIIDFLLNEIETPYHYTTTGNSIELLSDFEVPPSKRDALKKVLINITLSNNCPDIIINKALFCLSDHSFDSREIVDQIVLPLKTSENEKVRSGLYHYLLNSDYLDEYIDLFIDGITPALNREIISDFTYLLKGLNRAKSADSLTKILVYFTTNPKELDRLYTRKQIEIIDNSINAYLEDSSILDIYLELFKVLILKYYNEYWNDFLRFFEKTATTLDAFQKIYSSKNKSENSYAILAVLADSSCFEFIIKEYEQKKLDKIEMWTFQHQLLHINKKCGIYFNNLINKKFRNTFILHVNETHNEDGLLRIQKDVDLLLDKELFIKEIKRIFEIVGKQNIPSKELHLIHYNYPSHNFSRKVIHTLSKIANEETISLEKSLEKINSLNWDKFSFEKIYVILLRNDVELLENQKKYISDWCESHINEVNFELALTVRDGQINTKWTEKILWCFLRKLKLTYPKQTLLDMISYDWFDERENYLGIEYLEERVNHQEMKNRVLSNLDKGIEIDIILRNHISFCNKHKVKEVLQFLPTIITDIKREEQTRIIALSTTVELDDYSQLQEILPTITDEFKWNVVRDLINKNIDSCENFLLNCLNSDDEKDKFNSAVYLTRQQNLKGLEYYVHWIREKNSYPYYEYKNPIKNLFIVESIPYLFDLLKLSYEDDINQHPFNTLHRDVLDAFRNVALFSTDNYIEVKKCIKQFIDENSTENDSINFLNRYLNNLETDYYMSQNENENISSVIIKLGECKIDGPI